MKNGPMVKPIQSGVFKGTYSSHGIELIRVSYVESEGVFKLEGLKLTGDPNVPFNRVSFYADLNKAIVLTEEFQRESRCDDLISGIEESSLNLEESMPSQPFILPRDTFVDDSRFNRRMCKYRFKGNLVLFSIHHTTHTALQFSVHNQSLFVDLCVATQCHGHKHKP